MAELNRDPIRCIGTGFIALDIIRSAFDESKTLEKRYAGGSCGNVLANLSYLGVSTYAVGRVGDDVAGEELLADLRRSKVNTKHLVCERERHTPVVIQESYMDRHGNPRHRFSRACHACGATMPGYRPLRERDVPVIASALPEHKFFYFDRVARGNVRLAQRSRKQGALVVFEPSGIKNEQLFVDCLRTSHVLKYSCDRISNLDTLVSRAPPLLEIATLGSDGMRFRVRASGGIGSWRTLPALAAPEFRDSAGSGDWCTAALIVRLARSPHSVSSLLADIDALADILQFGQALAAVNCAYDGARGMMYAMPRSQALRAAKRVLSNGIPRLPENSIPHTLTLELDQACRICARI